ncbi:hypothetical protein DNFV4_00860 [Nitrospira tepida]|uniref:THIF-type NAD/FAD binding fold domain-containing protein n=1 Tax=Nitrospira tepida TaxID=2973512 RepID=A0AA86MWR8_9BACT|nr:TOMM precursor leader peptide-binding protein [Nitrospira tepida]CAI4030432.1 hypothetical protein DNFV4_00860 [Nitrospira tepida]
MEPPLRSMPTQIIPIAGGVLLKRGCTEVKINGDRAAAIVRDVLLAAAFEEKAGEEICEQFAEPDRPVVRQLINQLIQRRLLLPTNRSHLRSDELEEGEDVFYWHFESSLQEVRNRLAAKHLGILGVNFISRRLIAELRDSGFEHLTIIDLPILRNLRMFDVPDSTPNLGQGEGDDFLSFVEWDRHPARYPLDCLVAACDFAAADCFRQINALCIKQALPMMPVMLHNMVGTVGPLMIPGETPCYECFTLREHSNREDAHTASIFDRMAFEGQGVTGFHPVMATVSAEVACFELIGVFSDVLPKRKPGTFIEINVLAGQMSRRRALKVPRCPVCGPVVAHPPISITKALADERAL